MKAGRRGGPDACETSPKGCGDVAQNDIRWLAPHRGYGRGVANARQHGHTLPLLVDSALTRNDFRSGVARRRHPRGPEGP